MIRIYFRYRTRLFHQDHFAGTAVFSSSKAIGVDPTGKRIPLAVTAVENYMVTSCSLICIHQTAH